MSTRRDGFTGFDGTTFDANKSDGVTSTDPNTGETTSTDSKGNSTTRNSDGAITESTDTVVPKD